MKTDPISWRQRHRSFYYANAPELPMPALDLDRTALLVIDVQNKYTERPPRELLAGESELLEWDRWNPFHERMRQIVIPNIAEAIAHFRLHDREVIFARIACLTPDGRDRSLSQKMPGFNNLLMPHTTHESRIIEALAPREEEIVVTKTTDSALTGTNLRIILHNMEIRHVIVAGIFTDQCVSSTVRSLADESFHVIVLDDGCAAGTDELHDAELNIINNIYCHVMNWSEAREMLEDARAGSNGKAPAGHRGAR